MSGLADFGAHKSMRAPTHFGTAHTWREHKTYRQCGTAHFVTALAYSMCSLYCHHLTANESSAIPTLSYGALPKPPARPSSQ